MPELPEVETIVRGLRRTVVGRRILSVTLGKTDFMDDPAAIEMNLPGRRIEGIERYGKFMVVRLSETNGDKRAPGLLVHLGMTGRLAPVVTERPQEKHTHACFELDDGRDLRYTDPRRFGRMAFLAEVALAEALAPLGAEPLEVSAEEFQKRLRERRARIKALLLDQHVLRGVGNIYADESLWRAKIHPQRLGARLSRKEASALHRALQEILRRAIALRGSSISDFVDAEGLPGDYQRRHRAYGREGKPCARCKTRIRRIIVAGRSSYFCPRCQRAPRGRSETRRGKRGV
jgi:formamidopyrimidine-DNA glycosylase